MNKRTQELLDIADEGFELTADELKLVHGIDFAGFPSSSTSGVRFGADGPLGASWTTTDGHVVDLLTLKAIWLRRPGGIVPSTTGAFVTAEIADFIDDVWDLEPLPVLPAAAPVVRRAQKKIRQLELAVRAGFEIPPTLVTNDPDEALDFVAGRATAGSKQVGLPTCSKRLERVLATPNGSRTATSPHRGAAAVSRDSAGRGAKRHEPCHRRRRRNFAAIHSQGNPAPRRLAALRRRPDVA
jgi:hypothetical protein